MPPNRTRRGQTPSTKTTLFSGAETTLTICTETRPSRRPLYNMGFPRHRVTRQIILWQPPILRPVVARCGATAKALVPSSALHGWIGLGHNRLKGRVSLNNAQFFMKVTALQALPPSTLSWGLWDAIQGGRTSRFTTSYPQPYPLAKSFFSFHKAQKPISPRELNSAQAEKEIPNVPLLQSVPERHVRMPELINEVTVSCC